MQVKSACSNCRKACKKCSDYRPCERCVSLGMEDSCRDIPRKSRKRVPHGFVEELGDFGLPPPPSSRSKTVKRQEGRRDLKGVDPVDIENGIMQWISKTVDTISLKERSSKNTKLESDVAYLEGPLLMNPSLTINDPMTDSDIAYLETLDKESLQQNMRPLFLDHTYGPHYGSAFEYPTHTVRPPYSDNEYFEDLSQCLTFAFNPSLIQFSVYS
jgi:hypothetical protein